MIKFDELPAFDTSALGATARCPLAVGRRTYHDIFLKVEGQGVGAAGAVLDVRHGVEYVELFQNGKSKLTVKPASQLIFRAFFNTTSDSGPVNFLTIPLSRPGILDSDWATGDMESLQLAVKLKSSLPDNGGNPACTLTRVRAFAAFEDLATPAARGNVFTQSVVTPNTPVAGWNTIDNLTVGSLATLTRLLFSCPLSGTNLSNSAGNAIRHVKISIGGQYLFNAEKHTVDAALVHNWLYKAISSSPAQGHSFPVMLDHTNRVVDFPALLDGNVRQPVKVEYYWDTAFAAVEPIEILVEGIELGVSRPTVAAQ